MKKVYLIVFLNTLFMDVWAQNFEWVKREGLYEYDYGYGLGTDNSGNVYVAGKFEQAANFSGTTLSWQGNHDMYVAKYNSSGGLVWIQTCGGSLGDYAHAMACDKTSAVYVAGEIEGTNETIHFSNSTTTLTAISDNDIFVAKYDLSGNLLWAKSAGGSGGEKGLGVSYDNAGNVYICGQYKDNITFNGTTTLTHTGSTLETDAFIAKYDANGNFLWARSAGGPGRDEALTIKCTPAGDAYICGLYSDGAVFGSNPPLTIADAPSGGKYMNAFLAKYATDGTLQWVKTAGGDYDDVAWSVTLDNAGTVYITGEFNAYAMFDSHGIGTTGNADVFVAAYDPSGNNTWVVKAGGALIDRARAISSDGTKLFITGQYGSALGAPAMFGSTSIVAADSSDIFIAGLDNTGNFLWSKTVSGPADSPEYLGYESGDAIIPDGTNLYVTGALLNGGTFGSMSVTGYDHTDMFLTKLDLLTGIDETQNEGSLSVYPNPGNGIFTINLKDLKGEKAQYTLYNYLGEKIESGAVRSNNSLNVDISSHDKGIYFVEIRTNAAVYKEKLILQ